MNHPDSYVRLRSGDLGRTIGDVIEDGMVIDQIHGYTKPDCIETVRLQYPKLPIFDVDEHQIPQKQVVVESEDGDSFMIAQSHIDLTVAEILGEVQRERARGTLKPFVEGEPIGCIPVEHQTDHSYPLRRV